MKKLDLHFKFTKIDQGCLLASLEIVMNFLGKKLDIKKISKDLFHNGFGYDILEVADYLIKQGFKIEIGSFDPDIFKIRKTNFTIEDLENIDPKKLTKYPKQDLQELIKFAKKHPVNLKIGYKKLDYLKQIVAQDLPVIVNLDIKTYTGDETDNSIHSVVIGGYDNKDIFVMDPILEKLRVSSKKFAKAWFEAGQYYLVVKK